MKEVKAYVRRNMAEPVLTAVVAAGCEDVSLYEVRGITGGLPADAYSFSVQLGHGFEPMVKLELVCRDDAVDRVVSVIEKAAHTGRRGDGRIFVVTVESAVGIATGERGESALSS